MKQFIIIIAMSISSIVYCQTNTKELGKVGTVSIEFVEGMQNDNLYKLFFFSFQNLKYQHIIDLGSICLSSVEEYDTFRNSLKEAMSKDKTDFEWKINQSSSVSVKFNSKWVFLHDKSKGDLEKYTALSSKKVQQLINSLDEHRHYLE